MKLNRIVRHTLPTKYDTAPFGTICQANYGDDSFELFIQLNDHGDARWEPVGSLMECAFSEILEHEEFIQELLLLSVANDNKSFENIAKILASIHLK